MSGQGNRIRAVARDDGGRSGAGNTTSALITAELRALQRQSRAVLALDEIIAAMAPCVSGLLAAGMLVSFSRARDGRSLRMSVLDGKEWIEFFLEDPDDAAQQGQQLLDILDRVPPAG